MEATLVQQGLELMLFGMATVFCFLALLVLLTLFMSMLIRHFSPSETNTRDGTEPLDSDTAIDSAVLVAISAAIHQFRNKNR